MAKDMAVAAECFGVRVPQSPFLNELRIARLNAGRYEGQEIEGALHVVGSDDVVLEIGAGIGVVGAVIAHNARPRAVHSFEANPALIPWINELYERNDLKGRISVRNEVLIASPDRPETVSFHIRSSFLGSSLIKSERRPTEEVEVTTVSFQDVCAAIKPTVLVMDIEGGELDLLEHADLSPFRAIVLEYHPEAYEVAGMRRCKNIIRDAGFVRVDEKSTRTVWTCLREAG
ncbi:FkbM family methyltransferase [Lutimaribacter marinistellae]|uniref:FkbM family methyltransferase n=1 Tax=Lutimaribacter marinistellae TaxID=1820329 RepID=A0ABV7TGU7_9RHOB